MSKKPLSEDQRSSRGWKKWRSLGFFQFVLLNALVAGLLFNIIVLFTETLEGIPWTIQLTEWGFWLRGLGFGILFGFFNWLYLEYRFPRNTQS